MSTPGRLCDSKKQFVYLQEILLESWKLCAFVLRICRFNTRHTFQTNKSLHPAFRQTILKWSKFLQEKKKKISILFLWKIIASFARFARVQRFSAHSFLCRPFPFFHPFLLHFSPALKLDECGQINQGNAEGRKIAPFPFQYNLKWKEKRGDGGLGWSMRRWDGLSLFWRWKIINFLIHLWHVKWLMKTQSEKNHCDSQSL